MTTNVVDEIQMQKEILDTIIVGKVGPRVRLYDFLVGKSFHLPSRKSVKKAIRKKLITVNGSRQTWDYFVQENDIIEIYKEDVPVKKIFKLKLEVVFEDEFLAVINKPAGYPVSGNYFKTIENALPYNLEPSSEMDKLDFARPVHRLDSSTSGFLIIAKTKSCRIGFGRMFENHEIKKSYSLVAIGNVPKFGVIKIPIENKPSHSEFKTIKLVDSIKNRYLSLVECEIKTGRTHQIRKHFSGIGHPLLGDDLYGEKGKVLKGKGLFLSATKLSFVHPKLNQSLQFEKEIPKKFLTKLTYEQSKFDHQKKIK